MYRIMIVEDDLTIAQTMASYLASWGYDVSVAHDFHDVIRHFADTQPHLVLMDVSLPFYNGFHWCAEIRKLSQVPIIFISSISDNMSVVMAVNMGGDDFIAKPFDLQVLLAKIQALLRRTYDFSGQNSYLEYQGMVLNTGDATVVYRDHKIELTKNEYKILQILLENKGKIVSREDLMVRLWESDAFVDDNTLTVNMTRLRRKLEQLGIEDMIKTKKGIGYLVEQQ